MIAEYSQISTRKPQTVFKVIRGEDSRGHGESSFRAEESGTNLPRPGGSNSRRVGGSNG